ncbi:MAG: MBL fold metallo-hydrolase [Phycisphaerales bacterium]|nr:MBL fold metallo-hydrolase [Phycisphaerales bacterium]
MTAPAEFEYDAIRLRGVSLAGEESYIVAPEMNLGFDIGRCQRDVLGVDHLFLTHGHMDHAAGAAYYFSQRMFIDNAPGNVYAPEPIVEPLRRLMGIWADIDGHEPPANIHPVAPGQDIPLRRDLIVRPFYVNHLCRRHDRSRVDALGFAAIEVRHKLLDEFTGLAGNELVDLKKRGVEITRRVEMPVVTYCGDSADGEFFDLDYVKNARVLLMECTFVDRDDRERARAGYHTHLLDLRGILPRLNNERILLTHLTRRTNLRDARAALKNELDASMLERISFFMEHRRRPRKAAQPGDAEE